MITLGDFGKINMHNGNHAVLPCAQKCMALAFLEEAVIRNMNH